MHQWVKSVRGWSCPRLVPTHSPFAHTPPRWRCYGPQTPAAQQQHFFCDPERSWAPAPPTRNVTEAIFISRAKKPKSIYDIFIREGTRYAGFGDCKSFSTNPPLSAISAKHEAARSPRSAYGCGAEAELRSRLRKHVKELSDTPSGHLLSARHCMKKRSIVCMKKLQMFQPIRLLGRFDNLH